MFLKSLSIMEVKVTIGTTPELTGLALAVTSLINGKTSFSLKEVLGKNDVLPGAETTTQTDVDELKRKMAEATVKEEKPKATRTRSKASGKEEPTVQEPPKEEKPKAEVKEDDADESGITIEDIRKVQRKVSLAGGIEKMKDLLATFGVESASELKESDYDTYYEKLVDLL